MNNKKDQNFNVLSVPYRKAFVVDIEKQEGFLSQQLDPMIDEKITYAASKLNVDDLTKGEQHFDVLAIPCRKAFIVDKDKKDEFLVQKTDPNVVARIEANASKLNITNLTERGPILVKKRRVLNKT